MASLQLIIKDTRIADWDIELPDCKGMIFKNKVIARQKFLIQKVREMKAQHYRHILKYPDYKIIFIVNSKM